MEAIERGPSTVRVTRDDAGNPILHYPGDYNVAVPGHRDIDYREQVLREAGVDTQVITLTTPGTHVEEPATAVRLARLVNDAFARVVADKHGRFAALGTLALDDPAASVTELRRCMGQLGFRGAMLFSNVNGTPLYHERFTRLYEVANELEAVLYIHPTNPVGVEAMMDYWLMPLVGFLFDTTLAAAGLVFSGSGGKISRHSLGAGASRRGDPVSGGAARPRLRGVQRVPAKHCPAAEHVSEEVLLRHREFRSTRD